MKTKVRAREYVLTTHAEEEMDADGLSIFDVESAILTGVIAKMGPTGQLVVLTVYMW